MASMLSFSKLVHTSSYTQHNHRIITQPPRKRWRTKLPIMTTYTLPTKQSKDADIVAFEQHLIDDTSYTFLVAFSGGKDSVACVLDLLDRGVDPSRIILHHHEVDGGEKNLWDWKITNQYCQAFADAMHLPLLFSRRDGGITREIFRTNEGRQSVSYQRHVGGDFIELKSRAGSSTKMMFPAISPDLSKRWCSEVVKIGVLDRVINNNPDYATGKFVVVTGERKEESTKRAEYFDIIEHRCNTKKRTVFQWRPILRWSEQQVWDIIECHNIQCHPCYQLGWGRCSCQTCIFGSSDIWASIAEINPEKIEQMEMIETLTGGHTLYTKKVKGIRKHQPMTIREKVAAGTSIIPQDVDRAYWIEQATVAFTAPIFCNNWTLPAGAFKDASCGAQ